MTALVAASSNDAWADQFCGGALIQRDWVLTAAHCTFTPSGTPLTPADLDVVLGRHRLSDNTGNRIHVSRIVRHPGYAHAESDYDAALLQLAVSAPQIPIRVSPFA